MTFHGVWPSSSSIRDRQYYIFQYQVVILLLVVSTGVALTAGLGYYTLVKGSMSAVSAEKVDFDRKMTQVSQQAVVAAGFGFLISILLITTTLCLLKWRLNKSVHLIRESSGLPDSADSYSGVNCFKIVQEIEDDIGYLLKVSENERRLRSVLDSVSDAVVTIDSAGIVLSFNSVAEATFGYNAEEVLGENVSMLMLGPDRDNHDRYIQSYLDTGKSSIIGKGRVVTALRKDGSCFDLHLEISEWYSDVDVRLFTGIMWDVSEQTAANAELEFRATYDQLTGVYNRSAGEERLQIEIARKARYGCHLSVVMLDIDYFKNINDSLGHQYGDEVLKKLASVVGNNIRETDLFVRWGGEEFIIILPETDVSNADMLARKLCNLIEETDFGCPADVTASLGVSYHEYGHGSELLLESADKALYEAKQKGRNCVVTITDNYSCNIANGLNRERPRDHVDN